MTRDPSDLLYTDLSKKLQQIATVLLPFLVGILALKYQYGTTDLDIPIILITLGFVSLLVASFGMVILRYKKSKSKDK